MVFVYRNALDKEEGEEVRSWGNMRVRVCRGSYKLEYEGGTEEVVWRGQRRNDEAYAALVEGQSRRGEERKRSRYLK